MRNIVIVYTRGQKEPQIIPDQVVETGTKWLEGQKMASELKEGDDFVWGEGRRTAVEVKVVSTAIEMYKELMNHE